jgi:uncharacterized protein YceK
MDRIDNIRFKDPINTTKVRKRMDLPNSLVMRIIILPWVENKNLSSILIGYKYYCPNHH